MSGLPESWDEYKGRPSKDAARALMAKVYLTMASAPLKDASQAQNARDMALAVMNNTEHSLIPDIRDVFKIENKLGPENIWCFNATSDDIATPPQIWLPGSMAFGWLDFGTERNWALAYPEQPRKEAYMILEDWNGDLSIVRSLSNFAFGSDAWNERIPPLPWDFDDGLEYRKAFYEWKVLQLCKVYCVEDQQIKILIWKPFFKLFGLL